MWKAALPPGEHSDQTTLVLLSQHSIVHQVRVNHHGYRSSAKEERCCGQSVVHQPVDKILYVLHNVLSRVTSPQETRRPGPNDGLHGRRLEPSPVRIAVLLMAFPQPMTHRAPPRSVTSGYLVHGSLRCQDFCLQLHGHLLLRTVRYKHLVHDRPAFFRTGKGDKSIHHRG
jgi:hypothetical protein